MHDLMTDMDLEREREMLQLPPTWSLAPCFLRSDLDRVAKDVPHTDRDRELWDVFWMRSSNCDSFLVAYVWAYTHNVTLARLHRFSGVDVYWLFGPDERFKMYRQAILLIETGRDVNGMLSHAFCYDQVQQG